MSHKTYMNDKRESYSGVVPMKRSNESQGGLKEIVEERPLAKENTEQFNPHRTLSRDNGQSGLDRIRIAATLCVKSQNFWELSEVGTVCVSSASTGLCGGCWVTVIPTATGEGVVIRPSG